MFSTLICSIIFHQALFMLEISVLEAALEILREIKEFDGDEQAAYALVTGFQNA